MKKSVRIVIVFAILFIAGCPNAVTDLNSYLRVFNNTIRNAWNSLESMHLRDKLKYHSMHQ